MRKTFLTDDARRDGFDEDAAQRVTLYGDALAALVAEDRIYRSNWTTYFKWDTGQRLWWIDQIEQQAKDGKDTIGAVVVAKAVELRLES